LAEVYRRNAEALDRVVQQRPRKFAAACVTPEANKAVLDGALAMAWTIIDLALDQTLRDQLMQP
jgi:hypothetical protein